MENIILLTEHHKTLNHFPPTNHLVSSLVAKKGFFPEIVFFGLQYYLKKYFHPITQENLTEATKILPNLDKWQYIIDTHQGKLPISIKAVPEGSVNKQEDILLTIENTDPNCFWLVNYLETLLGQLWFPCMTATQTYELKTMLLNGLERSGDPDQIDLKINDFGQSGASSVESAAIGGCGHLVNFPLTDNLPALVCARDYYNYQFSIDNYSIVDNSAFLAYNDEYKAMEQMLELGIIAIPTDLINFDNAIKNHLNKLKPKITTRNTITLLKFGIPDISNITRIIMPLEKVFGMTNNGKGFKTLNFNVRILFYAEELDLMGIDKLVDILLRLKWSTDNVFFGYNGFQKISRETNKFVFTPTPGQLEEVFRNGEILKTTTLDEVKDRVFVD